MNKPNPKLWNDYDIFTFYMDNIPKEVIEYQKKVFDKFDIPINQVKISGTFGNSYVHGRAIQQYIMKSIKKHFILFDIDCIPINSDVMEYYASRIASDILIGPAQRANHLQNNGHIYCGPCALGFSKYLYDRLQRPTFQPTSRGDTAEELTYRAEELGLEFQLFYPVEVEKEMWCLDERYNFGEGTLYEEGIYHAFNSRQGGGDRFIKKCKEVLGELLSDNAPNLDVKPVHNIVNSAPWCTVIVPVSNVDLAEHALMSIYNQDCKEFFQVLIIMDGPHPNKILKTLQIDTICKTDVCNLPYNTLSTIKSSPGGIPRCIGSALAQGKYICYLDQDNTWKPDHLSSIKKVIDRIHADVVYSYRNFLRPTGEFYCRDRFESLGPNAGIASETGGLVDTNCMCINRDKLWNTLGGWLAPGYCDDRIMLFNLRASRAIFSCTYKFTVDYKLSTTLMESKEFWEAGKKYIQEHSYYVDKS